MSMGRGERAALRVLGIGVREVVRLDMSDRRATCTCGWSCWGFSPTSTRRAAETHAANHSVDPSAEPDWMHDESKPWGIAHKPADPSPALAEGES